MTFQNRKWFGRAGGLQHKKRGFTLLETSISMSLFCVFLFIFYPNVLLFHKSYNMIQTYANFRIQEKELHRLLQHFFLHLFPQKDISKGCFIIKKWEKTWIAKNIDELPKVERGEAIFFSCLFLGIEEELEEHIFVLYFENHTLRFAEYKNKILQTGHSIPLLEKVDGYFQKQERNLSVCYALQGKEEKRIIQYELPF